MTLWLWTMPRFPCDGNLSARRVLRAHDLSGVVARHLSGFGLGDGSTFEPGAMATGDPEDEIRRGMQDGRRDGCGRRKRRGCSGCANAAFAATSIATHEAGLEGLIDKRMAQVSGRRAPADEVVALVDAYRDRVSGWNVAHFHRWYRRHHGGTRSYRWVKNRL